MIETTPFLVYLVAATVLAITPGVDTAIVLNTTIAQGKRAGLMAGFGIALGCLLWALGASIGLAWAIQLSPKAYIAIKYLGAFYLFWLGIGLLAQAISTQPRLAQALPIRAKRAFFQGLLVNLLNPKVGVFYLTFLPQFVPASANIATYALLLGSIHVALSIGWFCLLIISTSLMRSWLQKPATLKALDCITALVLMLFAIRLLV